MRLQRLGLFASACIASVLALGCAASQNRPVAPRNPNAPVIVYGANRCQSCVQLTDHLRRRGIVHLEKDVGQMPGAREEMNARLARIGEPDAELPIMDFRGEIVVGYDSQEIDALCDADEAAKAARARTARGTRAGG